MTIEYDAILTTLTTYDLYEENHERRVEARAQALLEDADSNP
jgi:hypothetical protein